MPASVFGLSQPVSDNGIKVFSGQGFKLTDAEEENIQGAGSKTGFSEFLAPSENIGRIRPLENADRKYLDF